MFYRANKEFIRSCYGFLVDGWQEEVEMTTGTGGVTGTATTTGSKTTTGVSIS